MTGLATLIVAAQLIFGLWILFKAFQVSIGWGFFFLLGGALIYGFLSAALGKVVAGLVVLAMIATFAKNHWQDVKVPFIGIAATQVVALLLSAMQASGT